jgi:hypothetical protein
MNKLGNLVAVGNSGDKEVVILSRDVASGMIGEVVARFSTFAGYLGADPVGNVTSVVWA